MSSSVRSTTMAWAGIGLAAALLAACNPGVDEDQSAGAGLGTNRGALTTPPPAGQTETDDVTFLREAAFKLAPSSTTGIGLTKEAPNRDPTPRFSYLSRLEYTAIYHSGYLASIPKTAYTPNMAAFGTYLAATQLYISAGQTDAPVAGDPTPVGGRDRSDRDFHVWGPCPPLPPNTPRWSIDNVEQPPFDLPLATDTDNPAPVGNPPSTPPNTYDADPTGRYIVGNWANRSNDPAFNPNRLDDPIMAGKYFVQEYYLREPWIPNDGGSRIVTMWLNRYGRYFIARPDEDLYGFGSVLQAFTEDINVKGEGTGGFLPRDPAAAAPVAINMFRGTFAVRVNTDRAANVPSIWPGAERTAPGSAPITYGWAYDPETGEPVGPAIHIISAVRIARLEFGISYEPYGDDRGNSFQPIRDGTTGEILTPFDDNFDDYSKYRGTTAAAPGPHFNSDPAALMQVYPFICDVYHGPTCGMDIYTMDRHDDDGFNIQRTKLGTRYKETFYLDNEVCIVPHVRTEFGNKLPNGTYRLDICVYTPPPLTPQPPTETVSKQTRYFHVWNSSFPSYFRP